MDHPAIYIDASRTIPSKATFAPRTAGQVIMPISTVASSTPNYVLIEGSLRIGPKVVPVDGVVECLAIYGFTDKRLYDKFIANSQQALKPYPLVKRYLRTQIEAPGDSLKLVVIDATGPVEPYLHAATMEAVLEAMENRATVVTAAYRLIFDGEAGGYRVAADNDVERQGFDDSLI